MARRTLFAVTLILALVAFPLTLRAQAAAESALVNSTSGAAAAKTGSALGKGLDQINNKLANQLGNATQPQQTSPGPKTVEVPAAQTPPGAPIPNNSPLVLSIQGAGTNCPADNKATNNKPARTNPGDGKPGDAPAASTKGDQSFVICDPRNTVKSQPKNRTSTVEVTF
jgi:hypothetical protein